MLLRLKRQHNKQVVKSAQIATLRVTHSIVMRYRTKLSRCSAIFTGQFHCTRTFGIENEIAVFHKWMIEFLSSLQSWQHKFCNLTFSTKEEMLSN